MAPAPVVVPASVPMTATVVDQRPSNVKIAVGLLVVALGIGLLGDLALLSTSRLPSTFFLRAVMYIALDVALIAGVWKRQAWARIVLAVLLIWVIGNLSVSLIRYGGSLSFAWSLGVTVLCEVLRAIAIFLLFRADSNAWFKKA
jgi:hypothetical protein